MELYSWIFLGSIVAFPILVLIGIRLESKAGQTVGWVYNEKNPIGDNHVDFGIFDVNNIRNRDFINGYANVIILDFNVDGIIMDLIWD